MKPEHYFPLLIAGIILVLNLDAQQVDTWLSIGPLPVYKPGFIEGKNLSGEEFDNKFILENDYLNLAGLHPGEGYPLLWDDYRPRTWAAGEVSGDGFLVLKPERNEFQIAYCAFYIESDGLYDYSCEVESPQMFEIFLDGKKLGSNYSVAEKDKTGKNSASLKLDRGKFLVTVKSMYIRGDKNKWKIKAVVSSKEDSTAELSVSPVTRMNIHHLLEGIKLGRVDLSPDGTLIAVNYSRVNTESGKAETWTEIKEVSSGRIIQSFRKAGTTGYHWMPSGKKLYYKSETEDGSTVMAYDFESGTEYAVLENVEDLDDVYWSDDEKFIIYSRTEKRPEGEKSSLKYMDELGNRTFPQKTVSELFRFNVNTGVSTRLTFPMETFSYFPPAGPIPPGAPSACRTCI
jgi:hypothetical protein